MSFKFPFYLFLFLFISTTGYSQAVYDTVNVDFGSNISVDGWNNFSTNAGSGEIPAIINSNERYTGFSSVIFDRFNGTNLNGTTSANASLSLPSTASSDSYYGNTALWGGSVQPTAGITFSGLKPSKRYTFEVFASRMGVSDNRETKYKFIGDVTDSLYLNAANNSTKVVSTTLKPRSNGTIDLLVSAGENNTNTYRFYYLNALKIIYQQDESSSSLVVLSPNGNELFSKGTEQDITWASYDIDSVNVEYSVNNGASWNPIGKVEASVGSLTWTVPNINTDSALVRISAVENSEIFDVSNKVFRIDDPISGEFGPVIVVLGSSTAAGTGASNPDSAWVSRYRSYVQSLNQDTYVINLAVGGYTSYDVMPSDFTQPAGRPAPEIENNITKALTYKPWAIIVNLPSNDASSNYSIEEQIFNMKLIAQTAADVDVPVWVTTTQPRNFSQSQRDNLIEMRDSIMTIFGDRAISIFDQLANEDGSIIEAYNSGDGVHLNNAGHKIISDEIIEQEVWEIIVATNTSNTDEPLQVPNDFAIKNNYPNPFNPSTSIEFSVPISSSIDIRVYDITGREVSVLANSVYTAGTHSVIWDATSFATGMYIYRITARGSDHTLFSKSLKMMLIK
ncbi:MAG: GDSL-type esterase/lipase family protein [Balneolaceae bacterium]